MKPLALLILRAAVVILPCSRALASDPVDTVWTRTYGGDRGDGGNAVLQTPDGRFTVFGNTWSFGAGQQDVWLLRLDESGDTLWTRTYGTSSIEQIIYGEQTPDGGYIMSGAGGEQGQPAALLLIKTDSLGDTIWTRLVPESFAYWLAQTPDSGYFVVGGTTRNGPMMEDGYIVRFDANGESLWTKTYTGSGHDFFWSVQPTSDGSYVVAGMTSSFGAGGGDAWLLKVNQSGETLWSRTYGGVGSEYGFEAQETPDRGFILVGCTNSYGPSPGWNLYVVKTDSVGDTVWTRTYGRDLDDCAWSVELCDVGGYVVLGYTDYSNGTVGDMWLLRLDANGDTLWTRSFGGSGCEIGYWLSTANDGGYVLTGWTSTNSSGSCDLFIVRTSPDVGMEERAQPEASGSQPTATVVRGVLFLAEATSRKPQAASLLDIAGRKVLDLHAGPNDVSRLSPGVYFVRQAQAQAQVVRKLIITR